MAKAKRFTPPTLEEVAEYCAERGNDVDPALWMDHYLANGWRVGRNPMKDWRAAVRTWERGDFRGVRGPSPKRHKPKKPLPGLDTLPGA